jgi:predicted RNA-binding Zn ribbon-like protein
MTGQVMLDSYADTGVLVSVELVNDLVVAPVNAPAAAIADVLAVDPTSARKFKRADAPGFVALAHRLHAIFGSSHRGDVDSAAAQLNDMLATSPSRPQLAKENGRWRLHHHPVDAALLPMWTAICAEGLARMIGAGHASRLGICDAPNCGRVFVDVSKNGSRAFCSTTCQNRVKAAAFRRRRGTT